METTAEKREDNNLENISTKKVHKILDRPILSTVLLLCFALVLSSLLQIPKYLIWGANASGTAQHLYDVATALLLLVITEFIYTKVWFKGEFEGTLKGDIRNGFRIMIPVIVVDVALFIFDSIVAGGSMNSLVFVFATSLVAGIVEEITFRSLILANLMRITKTYKGMLMSVVVTSVIFRRKRGFYDHAGDLRVYHGTLLCSCLYDVREYRSAHGIPLWTRCSGFPAPESERIRCHDQRSDDGVVDRGADSEHCASGYGCLYPQTC